MWLVREGLAGGLALLGLWSLVIEPARAEQPTEAPDPALQRAAYDVIIVPRTGAGGARILTERGWRRIDPQDPGRRSGQASGGVRDPDRGWRWNNGRWNSGRRDARWSRDWQREERWLVAPPRQAAPWSPYARWTRDESRYRTNWAYRRP